MRAFVSHVDFNAKQMAWVMHMCMCPVQNSSRFYAFVHNINAHLLLHVKSTHNKYVQL